MEVLGIDIGGTGIKGALVNTLTGELTTDRFRVDTPQPATPQSIAEAIVEMVEHFEWKGKPIGCGFPGVVHHGVAKTAANVDKAWIDLNVESFFHEHTGCPVHVINDADAAGIAETLYGAAKEQSGLTLVLTVGTGIGSAFMYNGRLMPNTELGHLKFKRGIAEHYAADSIRKLKDLSWRTWSRRLNDYLNHVYSLFYPDRIILGGGVSKKFDKIEPYLSVPCPILPASLKNLAGIIGAAVSASETFVTAS
ncbi:MAG: ROK family protein [Bacteroidetes bacterium]|nr:MAG: ROK family protein [Bacteroidota bacterium]